MGDFSFSFDNQSLRQIAAFSGVGIFLTGEVGTAMAEGAQLLATGMQQNMNWQNPTGALFDSIVPIASSPYEVQAGSDLLYAWRRNSGFSGSDSLGRVYNDVGAFFAEASMAQNQDAIMSNVYNAVDRALGRIATG